PPPRPHALLLLIWPPSVFFFHLFATVSNIIIREILLGATTRLPQTTLHDYKEGFWQGNVPASLMVMRYTAIQFRVLHKLKTLASGSSKSGNGDGGSAAPNADGGVPPKAKP
ncbi:hypothetical protein S83_032589, partial [Arachis hypogaea]